MPLPTRARWATGVGGGVAQLHQPRRRARPAADAEEAAAAELGEPRLVEDRHLDLGALDRRLDLVGEQRRRQVVGRACSPSRGRRATAAATTWASSNAVVASCATGDRAEHGDRARPACPGASTGSARTSSRRAGSPRVTLRTRRRVAGRQREGDRRGVGGGAGRDAGGTAYGEQRGGAVAAAARPSRPAPAGAWPAVPPVGTRATSPALPVKPRVLSSGRSARPKAVGDVLGPVGERHALGGPARRPTTTASARVLAGLAPRRW